jgi:hypothetical protein
MPGLFCESEFAKIKETVRQKKKGIEAPADNRSLLEELSLQFYNFLGLESLGSLCHAEFNVITFVQ